MKAVQFSEYGGPDVLQIVEAEEPHAGPGQVRIAVRASGVNGLDWKVRAGLVRDFMPVTLPSGSGLDAAGVVDEVGDGVTDVVVGDAVFGSGSATLAQYAVLTDWTAKPAALSFEEAAGYPVPVETAVRILDQVGVQPGQTLLVSGAAGGVGSAVVQFARQRGIAVIGTASPANQEYLRSLGAVATTYGPGLVDRVRALAPNRVDAAFDVAGSGVVPELIELTGNPVKVLTIADYAATKHGAQFSGTGTNARAAYAEAARLFEAGGLTIPVARVFPFAAAAEAQQASANGHVAGGFVVTLD